MKIFDLHLDLYVYLEYPDFLKMKFKSLNMLDLKRHGDIPQFKKANLKLAVVNVFPFKNVNGSWQPLSFEEFEKKLKRFKNWIKKYSIFQIILNKKDLIFVNKLNKIGLILGVEGLNFLSNVDEVYKLYDWGIRVFGLNWNIDSNFSTSLKTESKKGLTESGKELIKVIEKLRAVIDLAHSSIATIKDVFKIYKKPVIFSHNGFKKVVDFEQNLDISILKDVRKKGGVVGLTLLPYSLNIQNSISFENWYLQLNQLEKNYPNNIGIGTDFFGFPFNPLLKGAVNYFQFSESLLKYKIKNKITFENSYRLFYKLI